VSQDRRNTLTSPPRLERTQVNGRRIGALALDLLIVGVVALGLCTLLTRAGAKGSLAIDLAVLVGGPIVVFVLVDVGLHSRSGSRAGQSIGKQLLGIRVVATNEVAMTPSRYAMRQTLRWPAFVIGVYGAPQALLMPSEFKYLCLHDRIVKTDVRLIRQALPDLVR
jgi:hypothetical protein